MLLAAHASLVTASLPCPTSQREIRALWLDVSYDKLRRPTDAVMALREDWPPSQLAPPEDVFVNLQLNKLDGVDPKAQTLSLHLWMRAIWWDHRLAFNDSCMGAPSSAPDGSWSFDGSYLDEMWIPDFYSPSISGSVMRQEDQVKSGGFWLRPDGQIWWAQEILWEPSCPMSFADMPYDYHTCEIVLTTFRMNGLDLNLQQADGRDSLYGLDGVRYGCAPGSIEWTLLGINATSHTGSTLSVEDKAQLTFAISFKRNPAYYENYLLVPIVLMFIIAWSSFFVSRAAVPARTAMVIVAFLTLSGLLNAVLANLPKVSESVWLLDVSIMSMLFVFFAILEYAAANFLMRKEAAIAKATEAVKKRLADSGTSPSRSPQAVVATATEADGAKIASTIDVQVGAASASGFELLHEVRKIAGRAEACLLRRDQPTPTMYLRDQDLDVMSRYVFPLVYGIAMIALMAKVPTQPEVDFALREACAA